MRSSMVCPSFPQNSLRSIVPTFLLYLTINGKRKRLSLLVLASNHSQFIAFLQLVTLTVAVLAVSFVDAAASCIVVGCEVI